MRSRHYKCDGPRGCRSTTYDDKIPEVAANLLRGVSLGRHLLHYRRFRVSFEFYACAMHLHVTVYWGATLCSGASANQSRANECEKYGGRNANPGRIQTGRKMKKRAPNRATMGAILLLRRTPHRPPAKFCSVSIRRVLFERINVSCQFFTEFFLF